MSLDLIFKNSELKFGEKKAVVRELSKDQYLCLLDENQFEVYSLPSIVTKESGQQVKTYEIDLHDEASGQSLSDKKTHEFEYPYDFDSITDALGEYGKNQLKEYIAAKIICEAVVTQTLTLPSGEKLFCKEIVRYGIGDYDVDIGRK